MDITELAPTITWSGDYQQRARSLDFGLLSSATDKSIPTVKCELGNAVTLMEGNTTLFEGYVFTRQKGTESSIIDIGCFDRGFYLKSKASYKFTNVTPEAITRRICTDFGISAGEIVSTGFKLSRNFLGCSLYDIVQTAYTLASAQTKKKYHLVFRGKQLCVVEKKANENTLVIEGGSNLMDATVSESIENMVNQVVIYNKEDKLIKTMKNAEAIKLYGVMQDYLKQSDKEDVTAQAQKLLNDNGVEQKITLNNLGNIANVTGGTVVVREPYTGLYGLFFIDSDVHTWKNGLYLNKLVVNFKNIMDEKDVGSLPNKTGKKTASKSKKNKKKTTSGETWQYINPPG
ncbi:hypothetical protein CAGA_24500 [Caproiciproducens galactitolivorans]|uniref:YqbQ/XkdQ domain-containing protein n=2 Tax=Caproiciproducens galactitolivorans TaxID=642589 RepID=A0A4Z0Y7B1_9FIRM|nr:hypothetical protein CAGA_24500 [Caproiciproducens galactitolivorans]